MAYLFLIFLVLTATASGDSESFQTGAKSSDPNANYHDYQSLNPEMKLKLWGLAQLPPEQLEKALAQWPTSTKLTPDQHDQLIRNLHEMERAMNALALRKAREFGLYLTPDQQAEFTKVYIQRRLEELEKIWESTLPQKIKMEETLRQEMIQRFATPASK